MNVNLRSGVRMALAALVTLPLVAADGAASASPVRTTPAAAAAFAQLEPSHRPVVNNNYIAVFRDRAVSRQRVRAVVRALVQRHRGLVAARIYQNALRGFQFRASPELARRLNADHRIQFVQQDYVVTEMGYVVTGQQNRPPAWGLDRIDQRALPLNSRYVFPNNGSGVNAYVIDSGIRASHREFGGRATAAVDFTPDADNRDCNGHGTHVAGTIGGTNVGVAKGVRLVGLKVLGCNGQGSTSGILSALDWVVRHGQRPAVVNMSLGHSGADPALDRAIQKAIQTGFSVVVAAGNDAGNACSVSPAQAELAITVGATNNRDSRDTRYSNYGACVNIFAPGTDIYSAWPSANDSYQTMSGTSMASPMTAGAVALILGRHANYSPQSVASCLTHISTQNVVANAGSGSPNRMLFVGQLC
ncbi:S8 family peptidase [Luedemannella flava]|uniref:S8 family peptidase n=1 Tax=Luedemannella flava TaxID=349316 RepID=A0ABP4XYR8_9ACTN